MKNKKTVHVNDEITDAVNDFDYSTQSDEYNEQFIKWRRDRSNPYAYNSVINGKESVFVEGKGFVIDSAADYEMKVLNNVLFVIGAALMWGILIDTFFEKIVVQMLEMAGVNIHNAFYSMLIYGGRIEVIVVLIVITAAKYSVPLILLHTKLKMPKKVRCPKKINDPCEFIAAVAATMFVGVAAGFPVSYSNHNQEMYNFFKTYHADMSLLGQKSFVVYTIFDVVVVAAISELLFKGEMFAALRQFGDAFAVVITSVFTGLFTQNIQVMFGSALMAAVSASGMLRSGSIFTAIVSKMVYKLYLLVLTVIQSSGRDDMRSIRFIYITGILSVAVLVMLIIFMNDKRRRRAWIAKSSSQLSFARKISAAVKSVPMTITILICLISGGIKLFC